MKISNLLIALSLAMSQMVRAEKIEKKSLNVNFNSLIEESARQENGIKQDIGTQINVADERKNVEAKKVIDFLDLEIGIGEAPEIVDRRAN